MKKYLWIFIIVSLLFPSIVYAKDYCKVVSGNGRDIGSEIACGTEHFYVIDSNDEQLKLMSKYNLNTNGRCDLYMFDEPYDFSSETSNEIIEENKGRIIDEIRNVLKIDDSYTIYKMDDFLYEVYNTYSYDQYFVEIKLNEQRQAVGFKYCSIGKFENKIYKQDEKAIGFRGNVDSLQFPYEGLFQTPNYLNKNYFNDFSSLSNTAISNVNSIISGKINDYNYSVDNFRFTSDEIAELWVLYSYKNYLINNNFDVINVNNLYITELQDIINKTSNKKLDLSTIFNYSDWEMVGGIDSYTAILSSHVKVLDLKDYILDKYNWLYGTTYWLDSKLCDIDRHLNDRFFVVTLGELCLEYPCSRPAVGLRPIVTIPNELQYLIKTKTDGNGTIEVIENSLGGETINFRINANKGYKLNKLVITSDSGEKVEFDEGEIINNSDGTISIDKNKFIMPFENVTIEAKWDIESILTNPKTGRLLLLFEIIIVAFIFLLNVFNKVRT